MIEAKNESTDKTLQILCDAAFPVKNIGTGKLTVNSQAVQVSR